MEAIKGIVERHKGRAGALLSILEEIQDKYGYQPAEALKIVSEETGRSMVDIYGVVTFYRAFRLSPRGRHLITVCLGTACHVRGAPEIVGEFEAHLGIEAGQTTSDREFTLETVRCLGACALGPIVVVDGHYFSNVDRKRVKEIIETARAGFDRAEVTDDERIFPLEVSCPRCNHSLMDKYHQLDSHPSIRVTVSANHRHGWLRLSSMYGSYSVDAEFSLPKDQVYYFFCPHCHTELRSSTPCPECGALMVPMMVRGGGMVQICSRWGCKERILDLSGAGY